MKIGIIGTGSVATKNYLPVLAAHNDVSLCYYNRTKAKASVCAEQFGGQVVDTIPELVAWDGQAAVNEEDFFTARSLLQIANERK